MTYFKYTIHFKPDMPWPVTGDTDTLIVARNIEGKDGGMALVNYLKKEGDEYPPSVFKTKGHLLDNKAHAWKNRSFYTVKGILPKKPYFDKDYDRPGRFFAIIEK